MLVERLGEERGQLYLSQSDFIRTSYHGTHLLSTREWSLLSGRYWTHWFLDYLGEGRQLLFISPVERLGGQEERRGESWPSLAGQGIP